MLYTGYDFYLKHLSKDFSAYPLWIAAYDPSKRKTKVIKEAEIHQFSEKISISGITGKVDGNDIDRSKLSSILLKK